MKNSIKFSVITLLFMQTVFVFASAKGDQSGKINGMNLSGPLGFIENKGQFLDQNKVVRNDLLYMLQRNSMKVQLMKNQISFEIYSIANDEGFDEATGYPHYNELDPEDRPTPNFNYSSSRIDVEFIGSNPNPEIVADEMLPDYQNYYLYYTPLQGITSVRQYNKITYKNLYNNIDLVLIATSPNSDVQSFTYDFIVRPGGNVNDIKYRYHGNNSIYIDGLNQLVTGSTQGTITEKIPESFLQNSIGNKISQLDVSFLISKNVISFKVPDYNKKQTLVIDPELVWATYAGGDSSEEGRGMGTDSAYNVLLTGRTNSTNNIATVGAYQTLIAGDVDILLEKYDSSGVRVWGTYYGGSLVDHCRAVVSDKQNNLYLGCHVFSPDGLSTPGSYKPVFSGGYGEDGLLAHFSADGFRIWATYYGGTDDETMRRLAIDKDGNIFFLGYTFSNNGIATAGAYQTTNGGGADVCLSKWTPDGQLLWGTFLGGSNTDHGRSVAVDKFGNAYVNGSTASKSGIAKNAYKPIYADKEDFLNCKFNTSGGLVWSTYWGGAYEDRGRGVYVDAQSKYVYFMGYSASDTGISTPDAYQKNLILNYDNNGDRYHDVVLMKFTVDGQLVWSTYLGGQEDDRGRAITIIGNNEIYVAGSTESADGMATPDGFQTIWGGKGDTYFEIFDSTGYRSYGSYYGGNGDDDVLACAIDKDHLSLFITGTSNSKGLGTPGVAQQTKSGGDDAFLYKVKLHNPPPIIAAASFTYFDVPCAIGKVEFTNTCAFADVYAWNFGDGSTSTEKNPTHIYANTGNYTVSLTATNSGNQTTSSISKTVVSINGFFASEITPTGSITECKGNYIDFTAVNSGADLNYQWRLNGANISGATDKTYSNKDGEGDFDCLITSTYGCGDISEPTNVTRNNKPKATITALGNLNICTTGSVGLQANDGTNFTYQWMKNGSNISGATAQIYTATSTGTYKVIVTNKKGCSKTSKGTDVYSSCKNDDATLSSNEVTLYPNPASDNVILHFTNDSKEKVSIDIENIIGQTIEHVYESNGANQSMVEFSVKDLYSGMYNVKLTIGNSVTVKKLIVQK